MTEDANGVFHVSGSHTYGEGGSYAAAVTIQDVGGSRTVAHLTATTYTVSI